MLGKILIMSTILMSSYASGAGNRANVEHTMIPKYKVAIEHLFYHCQEQLDDFETNVEKTYNRAIELIELLQSKSNESVKEYKFKYSQNKDSIPQDEVVTFTIKELHDLFSSINPSDAFKTQIKWFTEKIKSLKQQFNSLYRYAYLHQKANNEAYTYSQQRNISDITKRTNSLINFTETFANSIIFWSKAHEFLKSNGDRSSKIQDEEVKYFWKNLIENILWHVELIEYDGYGNSNATLTYDKLKKDNKLLWEKVDELMAKSNNNYLKLKILH